jgi:hypothetical protein
MRDAYYLILMLINLACTVYICYKYNELYKRHKP